MKRIVLFFIGLIVLVGVSSCYDVLINHDLSLKNNSDKTISILYSNGSNPHLTENNISFFLTEQNIVKPDSSIDLIIHGSRESWHTFIQDGKTKKLSIYVFDIDTLIKYNGSYSMNDLRNQKKYLGLLEYSEKDLDKINWRIQFKD